MPSTSRRTTRRTVGLSPSRGRRVAAALIVTAALAMPGPAASAAPSRPVDRGLIAFVSDRDSTDVIYDDVYLLDPGSGRTYRLTNDSDVEWWATVSPDGRTLAYVRIPEVAGEADTENAEIRTCGLSWRHGRPRCGPAHRIVAADQKVNAFSPISWTADSRSLLYGATDLVGGDLDIFTVATKPGASPVNLTQEPVGTTTTVVDTQPEVSADGSFFVYASQGDIVRRRLDGGGLQRITAGDRIDTQPELSPDGTKVVFQVNLVDRGAPAGWDVATADADPSEPADNGFVNLTAGRTVDGKPTQERFPSWSPDGRRIAYQYFTKNQGGAFGSGFADAEIFTMRPDGSGVHNETRNLGSKPPIGDILPTWVRTPRR